MDFLDQASLYAINAERWVRMSLRSGVKHSSLISTDLAFAYHSFNSWASGDNVSNRLTEVTPIRTAKVPAPCLLRVLVR